MRNNFFLSEKLDKREKITGHEATKCHKRRVSTDCDIQSLLSRDEAFCTVIVNKMFTSRQAHLLHINFLLQYNEDPVILSIFKET